MPFVTTIKVSRVAKSAPVYLNSEFGRIPFPVDSRGAFDFKQLIWRSSSQQNLHSHRYCGDAFHGTSKPVFIHKRAFVCFMTSTCVVCRRLAAKTFEFERAQKLYTRLVRRSAIASLVYSLWIRRTQQHGENGSNGRATSRMTSSK